MSIYGRMNENFKSINEAVYNDPEVVNIRKQINESEITSCSEAISFMNNIAETISENTTLSENQKQYLFEQASQKVVLEFQGNPDKNQEFIDLLNALDDYITICFEHIEDYDKVLRKYGKIIGDLENKIKKEGATGSKNLTALKKITDDLKKDVADINEEVNSKLKGKNLFKTYDQLKSKARSFNNKYSQITMEGKKKFVEKYTSSLNKYLDFIRPWAKGGKEGDDILKSAKNLTMIDETLGTITYNLMLAIMDSVVKTYNVQRSNLIVIFRILKIEKEDSFMYKLVNKVLK